MTDIDLRETDMLKHPGVHFPPPLVYFAGLLAGLLLQRAVPLAIFGHSATVRTLLIVACVLVWLALTVSAFSKFLGAHTTIIPNRPAAALVTNGVYSVTRNPMYVALAALYVGVTLIFDSWWPMVFLPVVLLAIDRLVIVREERYLTDAFPIDYPAYQQRVRRWL